MKTSTMVLLAASPILIGVPAGADAKSKLRNVDRAYAVRDCTPINGFYGYYGNPWCDTGSYRLEDIELRQERAAARRAWEKAQR